MEHRDHETSDISGTSEGKVALPLGRIFAFPTGKNGPAGNGPGTGGSDDPIWDKIKVDFFRADPASIVECTKQFTTLSWKIILPADSRAGNLRFGITDILPVFPIRSDFPTINGLLSEGTVMVRPPSTVALALIAYFVGGHGAVATLNGDNPTKVTVTDNPGGIALPITASLAKEQVQGVLTSFLANSGLQQKSLDVRIDDTRGIVLDVKLAYPTFLGDIDVRIHAEVVLFAQNCRASAQLLNFSKNVDLPLFLDIASLGLTEVAEAIINSSGDNSAGEMIRKQLEDSINGKIPSGGCLCRLRIPHGGGELDIKLTPVDQ